MSKRKRIVMKIKQGKVVVPKPAAPARASTRPRRRKRTPRGVTGVQMEFFQVFRGEVTTTTSPGVLFQRILHPALFPKTPYFSACVNSTHRMEHIWEWRVMITTATFTGSRVAVIPVDDPSPNAIMDERTAFQQVAAGRAAIATVTGTEDRNSFISSFSTTMRLSNALPQESESWVGFANGSVFVYLLDQPIGLSGTVTLNITVLARPRLTVFGPFASFMFTENIFQPGTGVTLSVAQPSAKDVSVLFRYQGLVLDTGYYMAVVKGGTKTTDGTWTGDFLKGQIYRCDQTKSGWVNKSAVAGKPVYFCYYDSDSSNFLLVGFVDIGEAYTFVVSPQSVASGNEYCVTQGTAGVKYNTLFDGTVYVFNPLSHDLVREMLSMRKALAAKPVEVVVDRDCPEVGAVPDIEFHAVTDDDEEPFYDDIEFRGRPAIMPAPTMEALRRQMEAGLDLSDTPRPLLSNPPDRTPSLNFRY